MLWCGRMGGFLAQAHQQRRVGSMNLEVYEGERLLLTIHPGERLSLHADSWKVGVVSVREDGKEARISLGMNTDLVFPGGEVAAGYCGVEHHIGTDCDLLPGHIFRAKYVDVSTGLRPSPEIALELRFGLSNTVVVGGA